MSANCPLDRRVPLEDHPTEKQAKEKNIFKRGWEAMRKSTQAKTTSSVEPPAGTDEKQAKEKNIFKRGWEAMRKSTQAKTTSSVEPPAGTDGLSKMEQTPYTNPVDHETMMCLPGQVCEDLCVPGPSKIKKTQHADPVDPEMPPVPEPSSCDLGDKKQAKEKNIFKRGWEAMRKSTQAKTTSSVEPPAGTDEKQAKEKNIFKRGWEAMRKSTQAKAKVHPLVAEQESQVHPDTSSVEPPVGTDGPSKMEQTPYTNPVDHETMMCLPGQVCEDLCVPGPSKIKKTQHADPVDPERPPVPEPSSCDLDDSRSRSWRTVSTDSSPCIMSSSSWSSSSSGSLEGILCPPLPRQVPVEPTETSTGRTAQGAVEASSGNKRSIEFFESLYNVKKLKIGSGGFGSVFLGRRKFDGKKVAIKRMSKVDNKHYLNIPGHPEPLVTEVALMLMMCRVPISPFVIQLYEWFEHPSEFTLIMEYPEPCETLKDTISHRHWCDMFSWNIMTQAVCAVKACIDHGVFYSDIHSGNFLFNEDNRGLKLIDFGCGQLFSSESYDSNTYGGVLEYCPPEVFTESRFHAVPANVWSLGVLLYELSNKCFPFNSLKEIKQAKVTFQNPDLSEYCKDLIRQCLDLDPTKRPSLEQMLDHEWFDYDLNLEWRM